MKILSWNVRGLGNQVKRAIVKEVICSNKIDVLMIQETKVSSVHDSLVKEVWGTSPAKWCCGDAVGSVGGILVVWSSRSFLFKDRWVGTFVILVLLEDLTNNSVWLVSSVYGPNNSRKGDLMRSELDSIHNR